MPEDKKKKLTSLPFLLIGLGIVLLVAGYYVYTIYFQPASQDVSTEEQATQFPLKKVDWAKELFGNPVFESLTTVIPTEVTVSGGETGNASPFITTK